MLAASPEVRSVVIDGIVPSSKPGTFVVDMSTIDPLVTDEVAAAIQAAGLGFIDAPVGRLATHADRGECLFIWSEPRPDHFQRVKPMLEAMGSTIHHCGPVGTCIHMKIVNNYLAIAACQLNAETLTLATRFGLDLERTIEIPNGTTANNGHLKTNFPVKALTGDVEPGFQIDLAHKDLGLALTSASAIKVAPGNGRSCARLRLSGYNCATFSNADRSWKRIDTY
jgi:4-hydroxybutyrate dehydrogenase/sulfolactaldehyde 3-reductase